MPEPTSHLSERMRCAHWDRTIKKRGRRRCESSAEWFVGWSRVPVCSRHHCEWLLLFNKKPRRLEVMKGLQVIRIEDGDDGSTMESRAKLAART